MAWRFDKVAHTGDLRKMFNQVMIHPEDQVFNRFLWRTNDSEQPRVYQWIRVNFGDKPEAQYPEAAKELCTHVYVDDIGGSRENEARCKQITSEIAAILTTGQFQVKEWHSNNKNIDQTNEEFTDFLGHKWNKTHDKFSFKENALFYPKPQTINISTTTKSSF